MPNRIWTLAGILCLILPLNQASAQFGSLAGGAGYMVGERPQVNQALNLARTQNNFNDPALNFFLGTQPINNLNRMQNGIGNMLNDFSGDIRPGFSTGDPEIDQLNGRIRPIRRPAGFGNFQGSFGTVRVNNRPPVGSFANNANSGNGFFQNNPGANFPLPR